MSDLTGRAAKFNTVLSNTASVYRNLAQQWAEDPEPFGDTVNEHVTKVRELADKALCDKDTFKSVTLHGLAATWLDFPDSWGETPADFRNELRDRAQSMALAPSRRDDLSIR